jgi:hypothetical protein
MLERGGSPTQRQLAFNDGWLKKKYFEVIINQNVSERI